MTETAKADVLLIGAPKKLTVERLEAFTTMHVLERANNADVLVAEVGPRVQGDIACKVTAIEQS